jgi:hypothetical protein
MLEANAVVAEELRMSRRNLTETGRDRAALAQGAGFGRISFVSVLAGVMVAYGAMVVLLSAAAAIAEGAGVADQLSLDNWTWTRLGLGSAAVVVAATLVAYLFGGYVAGRMARRAGLLNGLATFLLAVLLVAALGVLVAMQTGSDLLAANLRSAGIPASRDELGAVASLAGLGAMVAMLVGALLGGKLGERWHTKLTRRAAATLADRELVVTRDIVAEREDAEWEEPPRRRRPAEDRAAEPPSGDAVAEVRGTDQQSASTGGRHLRG